MTDEEQAAYEGLMARGMTEFEARFYAPVVVMVWIKESKITLYGDDDGRFVPLPTGTGCAERVP